MPKRAKSVTRPPMKVGPVKPVADGVEPPPASALPATGAAKPMPFTRPPMKLSAAAASPKAAAPAHKSPRGMPFTRPPMRITPGVAPRPATASDNTEFSVEGSTNGLKISILNHLKFTLARDIRGARPRDWWLCLCLSVRDRILERFITTQATHNRRNVRRVYYLSLEYLMGRLLRDALHNTGLYDHARQAIEELGLDFERIVDEEVDMGLGNGGLGRLAACFLDSLATLDYPAVGYGIHYEYGLFKQDIRQRPPIRTAGQLAALRQPLANRPPRIPRRGPALRPRRERASTTRATGVPRWVPGSKTPRHSLGHSHPRLRREHRQFPAPLGIPRPRTNSTSQTFNRGGYVEARRTKKPWAKPSPRSFTRTTRPRSGKELRLRPAILLRLLLAAGHHPPLPQAQRDLGRLSRQGRHPAQRHPPRHRRRRADAHPRRRKRPRLGRRLGHRQQSLRLHQPHAAARGAGKMARAAVRARAAAPPPDHLRNQPPPPRGSRGANGPATAHKKAGHVAHRGRRHPRWSAWPTSPSSAATPSTASPRCTPELLKEHLFADFDELYPEQASTTRPTASPRAAGCAPATRASPHSIDANLGGDDWITNLDLLRGLEQCADDPGLPGRIHGRQARQQGRPRQTHQGGVRRRR